MTDTVTFQNIDLSSLITLYMFYTPFQERPQISRIRVARG